MKDNIFYFQQELSHLYAEREKFVKKFPKLAPFLAYDSKDPDIERMIENFAILTARIHQEMDQNIPHIAESLINIVAPNYTNALPSFCLQEFSFDKDNKETKVFIPKGSSVKSIPIGKCICEFKTVYDIYLYPLVINDILLGSDRQYYTMDLKFEVDRKDLTIKDLNLDKIHLYLGDDIYTSSTLLLYIHLYLKELKLVCLDTKETFYLNPHNIKPMGLNSQESMLSYNDLGFEAFSLLREYFFLPEKFNFVIIEGLDVLENCKGKCFELEFKFSKALPKNCIFRKEMFSLSMTPIVNIFEKSAEPLINKHDKDSYRIFIDRMQLESYEIIQVKQVKAHNSNGERRILKNYDSFERFGFLQEEKEEFYSISNRTNSKGETYKEIEFFSKTSYEETITIDTICCNKNLPSKLKIGDINSCDVKSVKTKNVKTPSIMREVLVNGNLLWKLVSMLSFSYKTMLDKTSFLSVLESYSFVNDAENNEVIKLFKKAIVDIKGRDTYLVDGIVTKRGIITTISIKDSEFYSLGLGEIYRFGLVMSRFFASFASVNSFCEVEVKCLDSNETLHYPASFGKKDLI